MVDIKLEHFVHQVEQLGNIKNDNAKALLQAFDYKQLLLADGIINGKIKDVLDEINHLYYSDSEESRILNEDCGTYNLQVTDIQKADSEGKADTYLISVASRREGLVCGKFHLTPYVSDPNSSMQEFSFTCSWDSLTYFCTSFATNGVTILPAFPARKRLYYYTSTRCALDDFKNKHIKVSCLRKINDPYECMPIMHNEDGSIMKPEEIRDFRDKVVQKMKGFISFSRDWNIEPMWGLYADSYKGAVLEFDVDALKVQEVIYEKERYDCPYGGFAFDLPEIFCRKSQNWSFERESRWIQDLSDPNCSFDGNYHFIPIDIHDTSKSPITLKQITCGPLTPEEDVNSLWHMHQELSKEAREEGASLNVSIITTEFNTKSYGLRRALIMR